MACEARFSWISALIAHYLAKDGPDGIQAADIAAGSGDRRCHTDGARVFLKTELSARRCHDDSFPQAGAPMKEKALQVLLVEG